MSETEQNQKIIVERFNSLPQKIKDAITDSGWEQKIRMIAVKHNLVVGDAYILETNTLLVMLGIIDYDEYHDTLKKEINLSEEHITNLVNDINEKIFYEIKHELRAINEIEKENSLYSDKNDKSVENLLLPTNSTPAEPQISKIAEEMKDHLEILDEKSEEPLFQPEALINSAEIKPKEVVVQKTEVIKQPELATTENVKLTDPYREPIN